MGHETEFVRNRETDSRLYRSRRQEIASSSRPLLQFRRKFAHEILDLLGLMPMANKNRILRPHDDQVVNSEKRDVRSLVVEDDVIVESIAVIGNSRNFSSRRD